MLKLILASSTVLSEEPIPCADFGADEFCRRRVEDDCSLFLEAGENLEDCLRRMDLIMDSCNFDCAVDRRMDFKRNPFNKGSEFKRRFAGKAPEFKAMEDAKRRFAGKAPEFKALEDAKRRFAGKAPEFKGMEDAKRRFAGKSTWKGMEDAKRRFAGKSTFKAMEPKRRISQKSFVKRGLDYAKGVMDAGKRRLTSIKRNFFK